MNTKWKAILITLSLCLLSVFTLRSEAALQYEEESNDTYQAATPITLGNSIQGTISASGDKDYYMVRPLANGKIELCFEHTYQNISASWRVTTYIYHGGQYSELSSQYVYLKDNEKVYLPTIGAVNGVLYYIVVTNNSSSSGINYTVSTSFTATEYYEKELNNVYSSATDIVLGNTYGGKINNSSDLDYYKITAPADGIISIDFQHTNQNNSCSWHVYLFLYRDGQYTELFSTYIYDKNDEKINLPFIGAVNGGVYYVEVKNNNSSTGRSYALGTAFTPTQYAEKELNNVYGAATDVTLNQTYKGVINSSGDKDYYRITAPATENLTVQFKHNYYNSSNSWRVKTYSYNDGQYTEMSSKYVRLNDSSMTYTTEIGAAAGRVYYILVENNNSITGYHYELSVLGNGSQSVITPEAGTEITSGDGISYVVDEVGKSVTYLENKKKTLTKVTIPATVTIDGVKYKITTISANAFKNFTALKTVVIGKNVTKIGKSAFQNCKSLQKVTIKSKKLKSIGKKAFYKAGSKNYKKLTVKVPSGYLAKYNIMLRKAKLSKKAKIK